MKKNKKIIILIILILICLLIFGIWYLSKPKEIAIKKQTVKHDKIDALYENIKSDECTDISDDNNAILYLVFTQMKNDNTLSDSITKEDYNKAVEKTLKEKELNFDEYTYNGYKYKNGNTITREKANCSNFKYISKLYGYTYNNNQLEVDVRIGYINNDKVYNLNDEEIGNSKELDSALDKSTLRKYIYEKQNKKYYLKEVSGK